MRSNGTCGSSKGGPGSVNFGKSFRPCLPLSDRRQSYLSSEGSMTKIAGCVSTPLDPNTAYSKDDCSKFINPQIRGLASS